MSLYQLIYLVEKKNEVNRRRRRFWHRIQDARKSGDKLAVAFAVNGYLEARKEKRSMTRPISNIRRELKAKIVWNAGGMMTHVLYEGQRIHYKEFKKYAQHFIADQVILGCEE